MFALYALAIAVLLVPALLLGPRLKSAEAEPFETAETTQARAELVELGMPEWLAGSLTEAELELCDGASEVQGVVVEEKRLRRRTRSGWSSGSGPCTSRTGGRGSTRPSAGWSRRGSTCRRLCARSRMGTKP
ncbi:MAG: hypothetical protein ACLUEK_02410 [Oscillospiraceae bacterium]